MKTFSRLLTSALNQRLGQKLLLFGSRKKLEIRNLKNINNFLVFYVVFVLHLWLSLLLPITQLPYFKVRLKSKHKPGGEKIGLSGLKMIWNCLAVGDIAQRLASF